MVARAEKAIMEKGVNVRKKKRILFIKPNMGLVNGLPYLDSGRMEPLTFAVLKSLTPPEFEVELCDDRFEAVPYSTEWNLVGINTEIYTARRAYEIADHFRELGAVVVLGGYHATMVPQEAIQHADSVIIGDAEVQWRSLLKDYQTGNLKSFYRNQFTGNRLINGMNIDWSVFSGKKYLPIALTQFSRGCPNTCEYCATGTIYQKQHSCRPVRDVISELEQNGRRIVFFVDDNIIANSDAAKELFRALIPLKIRWTGQASLNFVEDPELMDLMLKSGCVGLVIGFESISRDNLKAMKKNCNLPYENYEQALEIIRSSGLMIWAAFLMGYDYETEASIQETLEWILSKKFAFAAFNILMPYPTTLFYKRMEEEGRLLYDGKWWLHDDYRFGYAAFRPRNMSSERLTEACFNARLKHNTIYQILRRATDRKTNSKNLWSLLTYFAYNPLFRDEMLKKHKMILGYRGYERKEINEQAAEDGLTSRFLEVTRRCFTDIANYKNII